MASLSRSYHQNVFINCPFDDDYRLLFDALVFVVHDCGFNARSAQEVVDAGEVRINKILRLIRDSQFGIHDISRTELGAGTRLPRFNMPLELGLFMGAKAFGDTTQQQKITLILERQPYSYQQYCSDIAGQDAVPHEGNPARAITAVRDWLSSHTKHYLSSGTMISTRFQKFCADLPISCANLSLDSRALTFTDYTLVIETWLEDERRSLVPPPEVTHN